MIFRRRPTHATISPGLHRALQAERAIDRARKACDAIEAEAHHLFGDGNKPSNELGRANGMLQAANRIRTALDQPEEKP